MSAQSGRRPKSTASLRLAARIGKWLQPAASSTATSRRRPSGPRLGELIDAFLDQLASGGASTHTVGAYRRDLRGVADRLPPLRAWDDVSRLRLPQVDSAALEAAMAAWATDHGRPRSPEPGRHGAASSPTSSRKASPGPIPPGRHSAEATAAGVQADRRRGRVRASAICGSHARALLPQRLGRARRRLGGHAGSHRPRRLRGALAQPRIPPS